MNKRTTVFLLFAMSFPVGVCRAQNPVVQTCYTADPAPMVYGDTVFLYTGHDADSSTNFTMKDWRLFSSTDMVNWTDRGTPLSPRVFIWAKHDNDAWASQCIERNGKFYWYVSAGVTALGRHGIGVAVSDRPTGNFVDALGKPLIIANWGDIDPTVFIDDDRQAYLYWGNNNLWYVKLNEDMISYSDTIVKLDITDRVAFGSDFEEGPWIYKRNGLYYLLYASNGVPEDISYSTGSSPTGPWMYRSIIMPKGEPKAAFTNHVGIADFKGNSYFFYHNEALPGGGGFNRSVCIEQFTYNADGTIPALRMTAGVVKGIGNLNPYQRTEAETIAWEEGVETEGSNETGIYVTDIHDGDYIKVRSVDFGTAGVKSFEARVSSDSKGGVMELHLDSPGGVLIGKLTVSSTGGRNKWKTEKTSVSGAQGIHDLFLVFKGVSGERLFDFDYWIFK
jgi:beta-xylosidase